MHFFKGEMVRSKKVSLIIIEVVVVVRIFVSVKNFSYMDYDLLYRFTNY